MTQRNVHARLVRLDERMTGMFRGLWCRVADVSEERAEPSWRALVAALSDEEIAKGLAYVAAEWTGKHPPSLPEFRDLCRPPDPRTSEQRIRDERIALEAPQPMGALPSPEDIQAQRERDPEGFDKQIHHGCNIILDRAGVKEDYTDWRASVREQATRRPGAR